MTLPCPSILEQGKFHPVAPLFEDSPPPPLLLPNQCTPEYRLVSLLLIHYNTAKFIEVTQHEPKPA